MINRNFPPPLIPSVFEAWYMPKKCIEGHVRWHKIGFFAVPDFFIYILRCSDGSLYVGHTDDIDKRLSEHETGKFYGKKNYVWQLA